MNRRNFIKKTTPAVVIPALIGGYSVKAFAESSSLANMFGLNTDTDHVLVIIQLQGGNDGLNMVIPLDLYSNYINARSNIAIPIDKVLTLTGNNDNTSLHPAMTGLQSLYNDGRLAIIQAVGYPNTNFSHFRATDIWMSASDSDVEVNTGWTGRYLNTEYPNFPNGYPNATMTDPLGIQIGSITSLTFQGPQVSTGMSISNPASFYNLVTGVQDPVPNTPAGKELSFIRLVASQTQQYASVITAAANRVPTQGTYPSNNSLADQLKIVAKLVKGGLRTRIYMVSYGSFDTHATQVNSTDLTTGTHATLLKNVSDAIKAFSDDCIGLGIDNRVIGMTFSEFGRRIKSNLSAGTDHGAASPLFVFGKNVIGGVVGTSPNIPVNATVNDNIPFQYDFRSVYASVLQKWFCVDNNELQTVLLKNFQSLPIINAKACSVSGTLNTSGVTLLRNYPNPFQTATTIEFSTNGGHTLIQIIDMSGRVVAVLVDKVYTTALTDRVTFSGGNMAAGTYYARLQNESMTQVHLMLKVR